MLWLRYAGHERVDVPEVRSVLGMLPVARAASEEPLKRRGRWVYVLYGDNAGHER
jgi:hypothetical protein